MGRQQQQQAILETSVVLETHLERKTWLLVRLRTTEPPGVQCFGSLGTGEPNFPGVTPLWLQNIPNNSSDVRGRLWKSRARDTASSFVPLYTEKYQGKAAGGEHDGRVGFALHNPLGSSSEAPKTWGIGSAQAVPKSLILGVRRLGTKVEAVVASLQPAPHAANNLAGLGANGIHPSVRPSICPRQTSSSPKATSNNRAHRTERPAGAPGRIPGSRDHAQHKVFSASAGSKARYTLTPSCWLLSEGNGAQGEKGELFTLRWAQNCSRQLGTLRGSFSESKEQPSVEGWILPPLLILLPKRNEAPVAQPAMRSCKQLPPPSSRSQFSRRTALTGTPGDADPKYSPSRDQTLFLSNHGPKMRPRPRLRPDGDAGAGASSTGAQAERDPQRGHSTDWGGYFIF